MNIYELSILIGIVLLILYLSDTKKLVRQILNPYVIIIISGFLIRICFARDYFYSIDTNCFWAWSECLYKNGLANFYTSEIFKDYPPGYMYVLYFLGWLKNIFSLSDRNYMFLIKMPAILADIISGIFLYKICTRENKNKNLSLVIAFAYILNPAVILNSSIWGQIDAFYSLILLIAIYFLTRKKYLYGFMLFAYAIAIKPQALIFTPVFLYALYEIISRDKFSKQDLYLALEYILSFILVFFAINLPFVKKLDFSPIITCYKNIFSSYSYATINAFNLYFLANLNWFKLDFNLFITCLEIILCFAISLFVILFLNKSNKKSKYYFAASLINILVFIFTLKMHERYLFPALLFLIMSYIFDSRKEILLLYGGFSFSLFINCLNVYLRWSLHESTAADSGLGKFIALINIILVIILIFITRFENIKINIKPKNKVLIEKKITPTRKLSNINKKDYVIMLVISLIYSCVAFINLGDKNFPESFVLAQKNCEFILDLDKKTNLQRIQVLNGVRPDKKIIFYFSQDNLNWHDETSFELSGVVPVFKWEEKKININARFIKIIFKDNDNYIYEMAFRDNHDKILPVKIIKQKNINAQKIFDEQNLVPEFCNCLNSTYFDEVYHARTAFEFLNKLKVYENTHPPLGKNIIAMGIKLFGMKPFGWRFFGALSGVIMLPVFYILAKKIFSRTLWASFAMILFASDFMHFAQTRIATVDSYTVLFSIFMYLFMFIYYNINFFDAKFLDSLGPLVLCAIATGLACATKWQGFYALAGLVIIFIGIIIFRYKEFLYAKKNNLKNISERYLELSVKSFTACVILIFFVSVPIYFASYWMFVKTEGVNGLKDIILNQKNMFNYHAMLDGTHPFSSKWWQWILNLRPILFYNHTYSDSVRAGISSFLNPVVCYGGLIGFFYCLSRLSYKFDRDMFFVLIAYLAELVPWILIKRVTYSYHYFPCVPFLILLFVFFVRDVLYHKFGKKILIMIVCTSGILFMMFYPVLSGMPVKVWYINNFLKWFSSWQLS